MAFPNSPTNGQSTTVDGINYTYSSAENSWTRQTLVLTTDTTASPNTVILQGVDITQNTRISVLEGVNTTQNTNITTVTGLAQAAFDKANTGVSTSTDDYARTLANTATNNIVILQGVNTTQNTNITYATNLAQAALNAANAITGGTHEIEYLVVGGGGAGGSYLGGGGGAGGFRTSTGLAVTSGTHTITVGAGGVGGAAIARGGNGSVSVFSTTSSTITSAGGGGGGGYSDPGQAGGSGGGGGYTTASGAGNTPSTSPSQGNNGGTGPVGGGGGASAVGANGNGAGGWGQGNGGAGTASSITGASVTYAGGGGGAADIGRPAGTGGAGGGGAGEVGDNGTGSAGTVNTGGGGGARGGSNGGRAGGSGIVILRTTSLADSTTGSPTITTDGAYNIYAFTSSGSITFPSLAAATSEVIDDLARATSNTATNNITILQGVNTTQNTRISSVDNTANAAYAKANAAFDKANTGGSGSSSGYLANSVIFANSTGYLTNTSSIQFFTSNNNLVLTGNVIGGGVRSTSSSSTPPTSPTVGDIWYDTSTDIMYRYTYDGVNSNWIDVTSPTVSSNASSTSTTTSTNIIISTISITDNSYAILDDTAVSNSGGYIQIAGTNFSSNCSVIIGSNNTISTTFVNSSIIRAQVGAALPTSYHVYITDSGTGAVGIKPNGLTYSSFPVWGTGSTLTGVNANTLFSQTLSANSDSNIVYSNTSVLPTGTSLLANGYFYGNVSVGIQTTYNFDVKATDVEIQDTSRAFSLTVTPVNPYAATNWSWYFQDSGNNNDVVARTSPTSNATFNSVMNGSTVTKEAWVRRTAPNGVLAGMILSRDTGVLFIQSGTLRYYNSDTTGAIIQVSESYIPLNTWTHVAITHNSGTVTLWINGSSIATASGQTFSSSSIALGGDTDFRSIGYMSQIRISNIVRYTTTFSPPTLPFVSDVNTYFLAGQSNSLTDNGVLGLTIVNTGTNPVTFSNSVVPFNL